MVKILDENESDPAFNNDNDNFHIFGAIRYMITIHDANEDSLSEVDTSMKELYINKFIVYDELELLPIPVHLPIGPQNTHSFVVHVVLSRKYTTEIDGICHRSPQTCFQKVRLLEQRQMLILFKNTLTN